MRAWIYKSTGTPFTALSLTTTHPSPAERPIPADSVLVKVSHSGLNAGFQLIMAIFPAWMRAMPAIPEFDFSGVIMALGSNIKDSRLAMGTTVYGCCPPPEHLLRGAGSLAEYIVVPASVVAPTPRDMSLREAAALGGCGTTALQMIARAGVRPGMKVLVNGGSGGLGSMLVQIAKAAVGDSGTVIATASTGKVDFVRSLGADEVIDYTKHTPLSTFLTTEHGQQPFDIVLDSAWVQDLYTKCPAYLTAKGIYFNGGGSDVNYSWTSFIHFFYQMFSNMIYPSFFPRGVPRRFDFLSGKANPIDFATLNKLVEDGKLRVYIDSAWEMENALKAYERITTRAVKGKVVVHVQGV